jgi:hypothetical protein
MSSSQQLPFLPGYRIQTQPKNNFHKQHLFDVNNGIRVNVNREQNIIDQRSFPVNATANLQITRSPEDFADPVDAKFKTAASTMSRLPAWVAYDRKVLRFYGYFKEAVFSSPVENFRVRKCVIYYYLEDDSVHIAEPKIENSGIPQGVFIKRHRIPKFNNEFVNLNDLYIGAELSIYGRVFRLVDCDDFTRAFFSNNGVDLGNPENYPLDPFTKKHTVEATRHNKLMHPHKEFMEASLGKQMGVEIQATQKFLKNDGKVLRFYCVWADNKMYGEIRPYIVHYFLADDTVEVLEVRQPNSGRDPFSSLLKRQKLPKVFHEVAPDVSQIGWKAGQNVQYYTEEDFRVGGTVQVYGRKLVICGCDVFTKCFYIDNLGMTEADFPNLNMEDPEPSIPRMEPPEHNGFGTEEDSLGSFLYLINKVPKIDFKKLMENDGLNHRFLAKFINPASEDKNRRFILTYYMNNDTISIFEKFERNSGFVGGKFLERCRIKNPDTKQWFCPTDLYVGNKLNINMYAFELVEADNFTLEFMANNPKVFGNSDCAPPQETAADQTETAF